MPSAVPTQKSAQKALIQDAKGGPVIVDNAPIPKLSPGDILVKTMMVALNPFDYKMPGASPSKSAVMGNDFVGTVVQIYDEEASTSLGGSDDKTRIKLGDTVCGTVHGSNAADPNNGSFAEYVRAPADLVLRVPPSFKPQDAATLGCALGTAIVALWDSDGLELPISPASPAPPGSDDAVPVLVYGGSTASGTMALQLLRLSGVSPLVATCSPRNFDLVRSYGATSVYDYTDPETPSHIRAETGGGLEHALDTITDAGSVACCEAALSRYGGALATLERCPDEMRTRKAVDAHFVIALEVFGKGFDLGLEGYARPASDEKRRAAARWFRVFQRLLDDGELRAHPVKVLEPGFESIVKGLEMLKSRAVSGYKLVVPLHP